ncbi:MAG TPA: hypothetical protein PKL03_06565 [Candidatus Omnitrophota bacterium]|nr:hypothetical protein [Candidatus Omnitrophota bacterium]
MNNRAHRNIAAAAFRLAIGCLFLVSIEGQAAPEEERPSVPGPTAAELTWQIRAKSEELKEIEARIRALSRAQRAQRETERLKIKARKREDLEELKLKDRQKYEAAVAEQFEQDRKREMYRRQKADETPARPRMTHSQRLDQLKENNPAMYDLALKKDIIEAEIRTLRRLRMSVSQKP